MSRLIAIRVPDDLYPELEAYCAAKGITITAGVVDAVRGLVTATKPTAQEMAAARFEAETRETLKRRLAAIDALTGEPLEPRKPYQKGKRK